MLSIIYSTTTNILPTNPPHYYHQSASYTPYKAQLHYPHLISIRNSSKNNRFGLELLLMLICSFCVFIISSVVNLLTACPSVIEFVFTILGIFIIRCYSIKNITLWM